MLSMDQLVEYFNDQIAHGFLEGKATELRHLQAAAGVIMAAAEANHDSPTATRFRIVAAQAANKLEELENNNA